MALTHRRPPPLSLLGLLICARLAEATPALPKIALRLRSDGSGERDFVESDSGRVRVFHGTNVVVKGPPWLPNRTHFDPQTSLVARDFQDMRLAGINLLRLGVMWPGAEPTQGQYSESYYKELRALIQEAAEWGMYVLLDMHQDMLSEFFCGEGIPKWAVERPRRGFLRFPFPLFVDVGEHHLPSSKACHKAAAKWRYGKSESQASYEAALTYDNLYTDVNGLLKAWGAFWRKTAIEVDGLSNVLGFELINEPFAGNVYLNPLLAIPYFADRWRLQPAYDTLSRYIREVDNDTLIFFAGVTWEDSPLEIGFQHAPGGDVEANRSVFAYHYYTPPQRPGGFPEYFAKRRQEAARLGTGLMMTESCCNGLLEAAKHLSAAGHSWIQWEWKEWCKEPAGGQPGFGSCLTGQGAGPWQPDGTFSMAYIRKVGMPYSPAVAGQLLGSTWNPTTKHFVLKFHPDGHTGGRTELFVNPALSFPDGFEIHVEPDVLEVQQDLEAFQIILRLRGNATLPSTPVVVTMRGSGAASTESVPSALGAVVPAALPVAAGATGGQWEVMV